MRKGTKIGHSLKGIDVKIGDILIGKLFLGQYHLDTLEVVYLNKQINDGVAGHYFGVCLSRKNTIKGKSNYYYYFPGLVGGFKHLNERKQDETK